ncbi:splicing factor 3A subunit 2 [Strigomonas culicis]|uniref:Splicing factor 3A subunit 2 n=1 Tax=Strigomonas culicis TaxID=28005 RepID=S9UN25_9TRYP|nr:splicing factor 3A subunit 2 [Strigomonas culicis]EPY30094.1 splicing factor 3A subunit 2 [Strigomonas culicis]EPY31574.1 splicing factor 3A subunit 2 [Strigomonas culicis]EPY34182.1 splicing factor 3A subunit 2 [Strigomonas culicis]|eukprot:EPY28482.1 splicing factor 3A subunit 2 [Strigomonas culicis]
MNTSTATTQLASSNPYYKKNHLGKVTCLLCRIFCTDENNFIKHISGKVHQKQLEKIEMRQLRDRRLRLEEERNEEARRKAEQLQVVKDLSESSTAAGAKRHNEKYGEPLFSFRTEHDAVRFETKVFLEFYFHHPDSQAGAAHATSSRPLHRWLSAREQYVEVPPDDYFMYLVVACEGYRTVALKFPAKALRSQAGDVLVYEPGRSAARTGEATDDERSAEEEGERTEVPAYYCDWNPLTRVYALFFVLSR